MPMKTEQIKELIDGKSLELVNDDQDAAHGLRLLVTDIGTGEVGLLAIEPRAMVLPDEVVLDYSYQVLQSPFGPPPEECLITDLKTNIAPAYEKGEVPFLFD